MAKVKVHVPIEIEVSEETIDAADAIVDVIDTARRANLGEILRIAARKTGAALRRRPGRRAPR